MLARALFIAVLYTLLFALGSMFVSDDRGSHGISAFFVVKLIDCVIVIWINAFLRRFM